MTHKFYKKIAGGVVVDQRFGDRLPDEKLHGTGWVVAKETEADVLVFRKSVSIRRNEAGEICELCPTPYPPEGCERIAGDHADVEAFRQKIAESFNG